MANAPRYEARRALRRYRVERVAPGSVPVKYTYHSTPSSADSSATKWLDSFEGPASVIVTERVGEGWQLIAVRETP